MKARFQSGKTDSLWIHAIFLVVLALAYGNHFQNAFIFDDFPNIVENENVHVTDWSLAAVKRCFQGRGFDQIDRPLAFLSFGINYFFSGLRPWSYHAVNWGIHFGTTVLLFWTTRIFLREQRSFNFLPSEINGIAFWNALLWSVHPINASSVTMVVQRMNIGSAFFIWRLF